MNTPNESLLKQALDALVAMQMEADARYCGLKITDDAIAALQAAIALPVAKPEPLIWLTMQKGTGKFEIVEPHEKATNPKHWTDAFPVFVSALPVQPDLAARIQREIDHCVMNDTRLAPSLGRVKGNLAVRVSNLDAILSSLPVEQATERNFCQRCGQRLGDGTYIHTCTPPGSKA